MDSYGQLREGPFDSHEVLSVAHDSVAQVLVTNKHQPDRICDDKACPCGCNDPEDELSGDDSSDDEWPPGPNRAKLRGNLDVPQTASKKRKNKPNPRTRKMRLEIKTAATNEEKKTALFKDLKTRNDRLLKKVFLNVVKFHEVSLQDLVDRKKAGKPRKWPKDPERKIWGDQESHMAVDVHGLPLAVHIPHFIGLKMMKRLYRLLRRFGREMEVRPRRGAADAKTRDNIKAYIYRKKSGYISGVAQLVSAWTAIGHPGDEAVPAKDVLKTGTAFRIAMACIRDLSFVSLLIDDVLSKIDPAAYKVLMDARSKLQSANSAYAALSSLDPTYLHGRSISYNRATPCHDDSRDPPEVFTPLLVVGKFKSGSELVIDRLGLTMSYLPGTLILVRGAVLPHEVKLFAGGQRISIAHFVHKAVLAQVGITNIPMTAYTESRFFCHPVVLKVQE